MALFKDKMWLWAHTAGSHDNCNIPMTSRMTPLEGAMYLGIPNMCRVVYRGHPEPPFEQETLALDCLGKVVWSIIGDSSSKRNNDGGTDCAEVGKIARTHDNVIGGIMDDFLNQSRIGGMYTPEALAEFKRELCNTAEREMELWVVAYTHEMEDKIIPYLNECDVATLWTWDPHNIPLLGEYFNKFRQIYGSTKQLLGGCYLWDYNEGRPMPEDMLHLQLDTYYKWIKNGSIDGVIFCSNNVCDVGLNAPVIVKEWIAKHKDEILK